MGGKKFALYIVVCRGLRTREKGILGVFVRILAEEGETWDFFRVAAGEFPKDDEIETFYRFV